VQRGWGHQQGHSPHRGVDATRQRERASAFLPDLPSATREINRALTRQACLTAGANGTNTRRSPGLSVALGLSGASPLAHSRPQLSQVSARSLCGVAFGRPMTSARRAHDSCSICVPAHQARSSARSRIVSHGLGSRVKTKPLRRRVSLGLDPSARHADCYGCRGKSAAGRG
jgi:hypothetical protein